MTVLSSLYFLQKLDPVKADGDFFQVRKEVSVLFCFSKHFHAGLC